MAKQIGSPGEVLSDQLIRWCCIDRLRSQRLSRVGLTPLAGFDPSRKVHEAYNIEGMPKSFVYGLEGKLVTQSFNMRTHRQFLQMLSQDGRM
jgi:hypothetical protein